MAESTMLKLVFLAFLGSLKFVYELVRFCGGIVADRTRN